MSSYKVKIKGVFYRLSPTQYLIIKALTELKQQGKNIITTADIKRQIFGTKPYPAFNLGYGRSLQVLERLGIIHYDQRTRRVEINEF